MVTNPLTGLAWTLSEVNSWTTKFGVERSNANGTVRVTHLYVVVDYTPPPTTATITLVKNLVKNNGGTAEVTDWTLTATGDQNSPTIISGITGSGSVTGATVEPGTYTLSETGGPGGYTVSYSCVKNGGQPINGNSIALVAGDSAICTITNDDQAGHLTIVKNTVGDDGLFIFTVSGPSASTPDIQTANLTGTTGALEVNPGTYSVAEGGSGSWDLTSASCDDGSSLPSGSTVSGIDVLPGADVTCIFTNTKRGSITVSKDVVAPDGGPASDSHSFNITRDGTNQKTISEGSSKQYSDLIPGTYTVAEITGDPDFDLLSISGDNDTDPSNGALVTVVAGQDTAVTITNKQKPVHLTVIKHVNNPNGGQLGPESFTMSVSGTNVSNSSFPGDGTQGTALTLDPGSYEVGESGPGGYYLYSASSGCSGTAASNANLTCTMTNSDIPAGKGVITIIKNVINDNGGQLTAGSFTMTLTGQENFPGNESGTVFTLDAGSPYILGELDPTSLGYAQTGISCVPVSGGEPLTGETVTIDNLGDQEAYICTITNDDIAPTLALVKNLPNNNGGTAVQNDFAVFINSTASSWGPHTLVAGVQYTVSEDTLTGYTPGTWGTDCATGGTITLALGEAKMCDITNDDQPGTLHIVKHVVNDNGGQLTAGSFTMNVTGTNVSATSFPGNEDGTDITLDAGQYSVSEDVVAGYGATLSADCSGTIGVGETKTCTITNDDGKATLNIVKHTIGADGTFTFSITGQENENITTAGGWATTTIALDAGTYEIIEDVSQLGWTLQGSEGSRCEYNNQSAGISITNGESITIDGGDIVTCTFTNTATGFDVTTSKVVDDSTPDAGQNVTFTLTLSNAGPAEAFNLVMEDVLPAGLSYVSDNGAGAYATSSGTWFVSSLPAASSTSLQIVATVTAGAGQTVINTATTTSDGSTSDYNNQNDEGSATITVNTPGTPPTPPPSTNGGGGGGGCATGFTFNPTTSKCDPNGQVLGASTGPAGQVLGVSCGLYMDQHLRKGSAKNKPDQVTKLQQFLNKKGFGTFTPTGFFGPLTEAAVKAFQKQYSDEILKPWNITSPTGLAYLTTLRQLNNLECPELMLALPTLVPWK